MNTVSVKRNDNIDALKTICAFLVVCIHIKFPSKVDSLISPLERCAVPIFFMISGYFYCFSWERKKKINQIKKLVNLAIAINIFYLVVNGSVSLVKGMPIYDYMVSTISLKKVLLLMMTNDNAISGHLWYMSAIIYTLIFFGLFPELNSYKKFRYVIIVALLVGDLVLGKYSLLILKHEFPLWMSRNFLFVGIPYFWIGNIIREKKYQKIYAYSKLLPLIYATSIVENYFVSVCGWETVRDHGISTTMLSVLIFTSMIRLKQRDSILSKIGKTYSQNIYLFHPFVISALNMIITRGRMREIYDCCGPIIVFGVTLTILACNDFLMRQFKKETIYK